MNLQKRINSLVKLGDVLKNYSTSNKINEQLKDEISKQIAQQYIYNAWFTPDNVNYAIEQWAQLLSKNNIEKWVNNYNPKNFESTTKKNVAVILAGNIPLVGMHDLISVIITGHNFIGKLSSKDEHLLVLIKNILCNTEPEFSKQISFTHEILKNFDAVIATGNNNSARYFEYYFSKIPTIIRKNKNSVAVLSGNENETDLSYLSDDIFRYFGLGCRNVSKIFLPQNFNFEKIFMNFEKWNHISKHNKYMNNYEYNKSVYQLNKIKYFDNGFVLLKNDNQINSPLAVIFYEHYSDITNLATELENNNSEIQCIVSNESCIKNNINFGKSQKPNLWDYADNNDTIKFLLNI